MCLSLSTTPVVVLLLFLSPNHFSFGNDMQQANQNTAKPIIQ